MILFFLIGIFVVSTVWEFYYKHHWAQHVTVKLWFGTDAVYAGQETKLYEVIENRKRMPVPVLEVGFHTKKELDFAGTDNTNVSDYIYKRDIFSVLGRQKITREIPVRCTKRGRYTVSDADITSFSLLYNKRYSEGIGTCANIFVYPKMTDVSDIMTVCEHMVGTIQCTKRLYEDPFAFRSIRSYTTNDPMKAINWKASAKTGALMVNTFDSVQSQKAFVFLDVEDSGILKSVDLVEESISISASIVRKLLRQSIEAGFAYNGNSSMEDATKRLKVMLPSSKKSNLLWLEQGLAQYNATDDAKDFGVLLDELYHDVFSENPLSSDTLLICITKNLNGQLFEKIQNYMGAYQTLIVVPVYRGEQTDKKKSFEKDNVTSKDNIHVLVKGVDRT